MAFGFLLLILLITLLLGSLMLVLSRWTTYRRVEQVSCARCGYAVAFSPAGRCSECGADPCETGVLKPEMGRAYIPNRRAIASALMLTLFCGIAGLISGAYLLHNHAFGTVHSHQFSWDQPGSRSYRSAQITFDERKHQGQIAYHAVCLNLVFTDGTESTAICFTPSSPIHEVDAFDPAKREGEYASPSILKESDVPLSELKAWAASIGLNVEDAQIQGELQDIQRVLTRSLRVQNFSSVQLNHFAGGFTGATSEAPAYGWLPAFTGLAAIGLAAAVSGWSMPSMRRRYRRPLQKAAEEWLADAGVKAAQHE